MGEKLGSYKIDRKLAEGGMGTVWLGTSKKGVRVVLKVPKAEDKNAAVALADEARMGARLKHPGIVETLDFFEHKGSPVLVVAFIEGANLMELRGHAGPLPAHAVAELGTHIAGALEAIHEAKDEHGKALHMLHRDVSPGNILVDTSGQPRLIDLGIARSLERKQDATKKGLVKGTFRYLAPEIIEGGDHTQVTDLWALGVTLWEAALGRFCVPGKTMEAVRATLDGTLTHLLPHERIEKELKEALLGLIAPLDRRIKNARVAKTLLHRVSHETPGGREALADAVSRYVRGEAPANIPSTEVLARDDLATSVATSAAMNATSPTLPQSEEAVRTEVAERVDPLATMIEPKKR